MTKLLKSAAAAAFILGFANTANAFELFAPLDVPSVSYELVDSGVANTKNLTGSFCLAAWPKRLKLKSK